MLKHSPLLLQIEMFSIQLLNEKMAIDVCGLFNLDYELVYSVSLIN